MYLISFKKKIIFVYMWLTVYVFIHPLLLTFPPILITLLYVYAVCHDYDFVCMLPLYTYAIHLYFAS